MPTPLGSYFWRTNMAIKLPPKLYRKEFNMAFEITLKVLLFIGYYNPINIFNFKFAPRTHKLKTLPP